MKKSYTQKIQALLITHLLEQGNIELLLPDGVSIEIGITQEGKNGTEISNDYCYVKTARGNKSATIDTYNLSIQYPEREDTIICVGNTEGINGEPLKYLDVV